MPFDLPTIPSFVLAIIAIVFGIIVLVKPAVLAYLVGIYLIIIGVLWFLQHYHVIG
jgi:uncharacterized membrane protein HdeD (DUF308 family)